MSASNATVEINTEYDGGVQRVTDDLGALYERQGAVAGGTTSLTDNFGRMEATLGRVSVMGLVMMDRLSIAQLAVENAQDRATNAQMRYSEAVAKFGPNSEQAIKAHRELEVSMRGVEIATQREEVRMLIMAGITIPQMIRGISTLIPTMELWAVKTGIVTDETIALTGAIRALEIATVVGIPLVLVGLAATAFMGGGTTVNHYGDVNLPAGTGPAGYGTSVADWSRTVR